MMDPLSAWLDAKDQQPLKLASETEVAASLRRLMAEQESMSTDLDSERLMFAARALGKAEKWNGPAVALAWLKEGPSHARLAVVLSLLVVSWNRAPGGPPPDPALVEELLSVHDSLPYDIISENTLLIVLITASRSGLPALLAARVRGILERAREVPRAKGIAEAVDAFLRTPAEGSSA